MCWAAAVFPFPLLRRTQNQMRLKSSCCRQERARAPGSECTLGDQTRVQSSRYTQTSRKSRSGSERGGCDSRCLEVCVQLNKRLRAKKLHACTDGILFFSSLILCVLLLFVFLGSIPSISLIILFFCCHQVFFLWFARFFSEDTHFFTYNFSSTRILQPQEIYVSFPFT